MDDVPGHFLGLPHSTTPAAVTTNKNIKMGSFKSSENIQKKEHFINFYSIPTMESDISIAVHKLFGFTSYLILLTSLLVLRVSDQV